MGALEKKQTRTNGDKFDCSAQVPATKALKITKICIKRQEELDLIQKKFATIKHIF